MLEDERVTRGIWRAVQQKLEAKLLEAVERGDYREVTPEFWKRQEAIARNNPPAPRKRKRGQS